MEEEEEEQQGKVVEEAEHDEVRTSAPPWRNRMVWRRRERRQ